MSEFQKHPSLQLNEFYSKKSYQGANPVDAKIIFVGRDPNWAINIEEKSMFPLVKEYLEDGVSFWKKYNIHHPFLHPEYKGDGKRYHKMFSKLDLKSIYADKISFVELIGFPTTGMAKKNRNRFINFLLSTDNKKHLISLDEILNSPDKIIFIAWGLINDFRLINSQNGMFSKLASLNLDSLNIKDLNQCDNIFIHRHFSDCISNETIEKMSKKINSH
ncbi:MAG TPA: hypothetical protein PLP39_06555 [Flavobacterium lutivivi]|nr:hypothetical protein [Flavobacterium lutivivi]